MSEIIEGAKGRPVLSRTWWIVIAFASALVILLGMSGAKAAFATNDQLPTQSIDCTAIGADYHRPLQNGDHINVEIKQSNGSVGQVNAYVDQNIAGGASYNGQNNLGLRIKILGNEVDSIPLTLEQIMSGVITFNYAAYLKDRGVTQWTVTFVQTNSNDSWPNVECGETPPQPSPTPTPTETPKPTPTPTETPKPSPTPTTTVTPTPKPTETPKPTPEPTTTPSPEPTHSPSPSPTTTPSPEPSLTPKPTPTPTETPKPEPTTSPSPEPTKSSSPEPSHTAGPSPEPSSSPSISAAPPIGPKPPSQGGGLAVTGTQVQVATVLGGFALIAAGAFAIWFMRRRRANTSK